MVSKGSRPGGHIPAGNYTCLDYRREMILVGLKKQLAREDLSETEKVTIEGAIVDLEIEMGLV